MTIYDELVARGLIAQVTDEAEIKEMVNNGKAVFYIGFDPTAQATRAGTKPSKLIKFVSLRQYTTSIPIMA